MPERKKPLVCALPWESPVLPGLSLQEAVGNSFQLLEEAAQQYPRWVIAYSGGKDSTAVVSLVAAWLARRSPPSPSVQVVYADTRQELPPLQAAALELLGEVRRLGIETAVVQPPLDDRFLVYMLGKGIPPPKTTFRWCTERLKVQPMLRALRTEPEPVLLLTGVRWGESTPRDRRLRQAVPVAGGTTQGGECGQGWLQFDTRSAVAGSLAPILDWRVCQVWEWLLFHAPRVGLPAARLVAEAYGGDRWEEHLARTGCVGCPLVQHDLALERVIGQPQWSYLAPLSKLRGIYEALRQPERRLRQPGYPQRLGPLTLEARRWGLEQVLAIQREINEAAAREGRPAVSLLTAEEEQRIRELIAGGTWPQGWSGQEPRGDVLLPRVWKEGIQPLLSWAAAESPEPPW